MSYDVDFFVIGAGSGGVRAARIAGGYGARAMVAEEFRIGGTCVIRGCVPKKLMVYASRFADEISTLVGPSPTSVRWLIVDAEAITNVDYTAARVVQELKKYLTNAGVVFGFARVAWNTRADFDRHHLTEAIGPFLIFNRLHDAVDAYEKLSKKLNTDLHQ